MYAHVRVVSKMGLPKSALKVEPNNPFVSLTILEREVIHQEIIVHFPGSQN